MANEIILTKSVKSAGLQLPTFKKGESNVSEIALEPRRLKISVSTKTNKATQNKFKAVKGYVKLPCYDEEGAFIGVKVKKVSVHFKKKAFDKAENVKSIDDLKSGYLWVVAKDLQSPSRWQATIKKDKDGNEMYDANDEAIMEYPTIWISDNGIIGLQEFVASQDALNVDEESNVVDAEEVKDEEIKADEDTGEIIEDYNPDDENESEEVEL